MSAVQIKCPQPWCDFVGRGSSISSARRTLKGHALRLHGAKFQHETLPLLPLPPEELSVLLQNFRLQQANSWIRRRLVNHSNSPAVGEVDSVRTGLRARNVTRVDNPIYSQDKCEATSELVCPDLSYGQLENWDMISELGLDFPEFPVFAHDQIVANPSAPSPPSFVP